LIQIKARGLASDPITETFHSGDHVMNKARQGSSVENEGGNASAVGFEPFAAAYRTWLVNYPLGVAEETLRFAAHRLEEQAKLVSKIAHCTGPSEAAEAQASFFNDAVQDYRKEAEVFARRAQQAIASAKGSSVQT
jgi:hypothetical protein